MSNNNILMDIMLRGRNRRKNARILEMNSTNGIVESDFVSIGGIDQWITIRGEDRNNPILLFIQWWPRLDVFHLQSVTTILGEVLHDCTMGSARSGQNLPQKR
ncbi:hypothetical protein MUG84_07740 [Paenibacillus sp. KQZ6P-2]|uniref:Uncharacterized protein n=1 Tax=Paenibacillus mangrovi TaxID=2931978 RepID=A0A9X2B4H5_9BACL|nr:hypothetical protein [Paenibacillus mangrovi]MCJ8011642.1 hypothetical protein [Paenibacillus mangrovi]